MHCNWRQIAPTRNHCQVVDDKQKNPYSFSSSYAQATSVPDNNEPSSSRSNATSSMSPEMTEMSQQDPVGEAGAAGGNTGGGDAAKHRKWWEKLFFAEYVTRKQQEDKELEELAPPEIAGGSQTPGVAEASSGPIPPPTTELSSSASSGTTKDERANIISDTATSHSTVVPGRRLEGLPTAGVISIPPSLRHLGMPSNPTSRQKGYVTKMAVLKQWEMKLANGITIPSKSEAALSSSLSNSKLPPKPDQHAPPNVLPLLDGRMFFSSAQSYPCSVFSVIKYSQRKEEAMRRRRKLEEMGGGGRMYFATEGRDWRGTSYRSIIFSQDAIDEIRRKIFIMEEKKRKKSLKRMKKKEATDKPTKLRKKLQKSKSSKQKARIEGLSCEDLSASDSSSSSSCSSDSDSGDEYVPGFLDDPEMVHGRHRQTIIGDKLVGPIVSSSILFVRPKALKAELNKQFRERFDGWEPPRSKWKFIGAKAVSGVYTLIEPKIGDESNVSGSGNQIQEVEDIRIPPSLTLSKIRNLKSQALFGCLNAGCEIGTVALACVFFERLCLDCRVDKSNRRLSMGACLLLAYKFNEPSVKLVNDFPDKENKKKGKKRGLISTFHRTCKKSGSIFASLLNFLATDWSLGPKELFSAEWGVFVALEFKLHATPSQVSPLNRA